MERKPLYFYVNDAVNKSGAVQKHVAAAIAEGDSAYILDCAAEIEAKFPVRKVLNTETGKKVDTNRDNRNARMSVLRTALKRVGKPQGVRYLVNKDESGAWQLVAETIEAPDNSDKGSNNEGSDSLEAQGGTPGSLNWDAIDYVLANLHNPQVLAAIKSGLEGLAS